MPPVTEIPASQQTLEAEFSQVADVSGIDPAYIQQQQAAQAEQMATLGRQKAMLEHQYKQEVPKGAIPKTAALAGVGATAGIVAANKIRGMYSEQGIAKGAEGIAKNAASFLTDAVKQGDKLDVTKATADAAKKFGKNSEIFANVSKNLTDLGSADKMQQAQAALKEGEKAFKSTIAGEAVNAAKADISGSKAAGAANWIREKAAASGIKGKHLVIAGAVAGTALAIGYGVKKHNEGKVQSGMTEEKIKAKEQEIAAAQNSMVSFGRSDGRKWTDVVSQPDAGVMMTR